jgi:CheY-like chemotaxis protein
MREDEWVVMEVNDNGPGIKEKHQSKIFDPFFTTKPPGKGTGLGLSITYSIIQRHGGSVWLDTTTVKGARFLARLPTAHSSNFPDTSCHELAWIPSTVLVVDDEKNLCLILSKYLESLGCDVDIAFDGRQAMEKIENKAYDVMLVDVRMPSMDGIELYQRIKAKYPEMLSRFAFMSGVSELDITATSMAAAVPVIRKPFNRKDILRFLSTLGR